MMNAYLSVLLFKDKHWIFFAALIVSQFVAFGDMENAIRSENYESGRLMLILIIGELPVLINFPLLTVSMVNISRFFELFPNPRSSIITVLTLFIALMAQEPLPVQFFQSLGLFQYLIWLAIISSIMLYLVKGNNSAFAESSTKLTAQNDMSLTTEVNEQTEGNTSEQTNTSIMQWLIFICVGILFVLVVLFFSARMNNHSKNSEDNQSLTEELSVSESPSNQPSITVEDVLDPELVKSEIIRDEEPIVSGSDSPVENYRVRLNEMSDSDIERERLSSEDELNYAQDRLKTCLSANQSSGNHFSEDCHGNEAMQSVIAAQSKLTAIMTEIGARSSRIR